jgi:hypothetical protein
VPPSRRQNPPTRHRIRWLVLVAIIGVVIGQNWLRLRGPRVLESWPPPDGRFTPWESITPGLDLARAAFSHPRPIKAHALRIDLQAPRLELIVSPGSPGEFNSVPARFPSQWLSRLDAVAAINATPFSPEVILPGSRVQLEGLAISDGRLWAPKTPNLDAFLQDIDGSWQLLRGTTHDGPAKIGFGGFLGTVVNGVNIGETSPQDAATCVGLSADRRWMYWLVVDGGQPGYSEGATPRETAAILLELGASDVLNLDGGSSSTLVTRSGWLGPRVRNRPRHPAWSGMQRPVGNVLAIRLRKPQP